MAVESLRGRQAMVGDSPGGPSTMIQDECAVERAALEVARAPAAAKPRWRPAAGR